jgi:hypothetical protein
VDDEDDGPRSVVWDLMTAPLRFLTGFNGEVSGLSACDSFLDEYEKLCSVAASSSGPEEDESRGRVEFCRKTYRQALASAARQDKLLLVYLHSGQHPDCGVFFSDFLPHVSTLVNDSMVAWGGSVEYTDAYRLSVLLNAATYPYLAVLEPPADARQANAKLVERIEGIDAANASSNAESVRLRLNAAVESHAAVVAERVAARYEANERQRLRREQDEALERTMAEDRRRDAERQAAADAERAAQEALADRAAALERKRAELLPEPPADAPRGSITTVRFQLGDGSRFQRRFPAEAKLRQLRDFVDVTLHDKECSIENYSVVLNFPKTTFGPDDGLDRSLAECGLVPQAVLFVQDMDA